MSQALLDAAAAGDTALFDKLIKEGAEIDFSDDNGDSMKHAIKNGRILMVDHLLKNYANRFSLKDSYILHDVASHGQILLMDHLFKNYSEDFFLNKKTYGGLTPLLSAIENNQIKMVDHLLTNYTGKVSLEEKDSRGLTPLLIAVTNKHITMVDHLLKAYSDKVSLKKEKDEYGNTALLLAVSVGDIPMVDHLLKKYYDPVSLKDENTNGYTAILTSVFYNHIPMLDHLMKKYSKYVSLDDKTKTGLSVLFLATADHSIPMLNHLLTNYTKQVSTTDKVNQDDEDYTLFLWAAVRGQPKVVEYLLKNYPNEFSVHDKNKNGYTALFLAARNDCRDTCKFLLKMGSFVNTKYTIPNEAPCTLSEFLLKTNRNNMGYLIQEAETMFDICRGIETRSALFLPAGSLREGLNGRNEIDGNTALHYAVLNDQFDNAILLITRGADLNTISNKQFQTAAELMMHSKNHSFIALNMFAKFKLFLKTNHLNDAQNSNLLKDNALVKDTKDVKDIKDTKDLVEKVIIKDIKTQEESLKTAYSLVSAITPANQEAIEEKAQQLFNELMTAIEQIADQERKDYLLYDLGSLLSEGFKNQIQSETDENNDDYSEENNTKKVQNNIFIPALAYQAFNQMKQSFPDKFKEAHSIMLQLLISGNVLLQKENNSSENISILTGDPLHIPNDETSLMIRLEAELRHYKLSGSNDLDLFKNLLAQYALGEQAFDFTAKVLKDLDESNSLFAIIKEMKKSSQQKDKELEMLRKELAELKAKTQSNNQSNPNPVLNALINLNTASNQTSTKQTVNQYKF